MQGLPNAKAQQRVIFEQQPLVAEMPCQALAQFVPSFRDDLTGFYGQGASSVAALLYRFW